MSNMDKLRYANYFPFDLINGEGARCVLFVTGCIHACDGCHNKSAWSPKSGHPVDEGLIQQILADLEFTDGLTLSGGDPLLPRNLKDITEICKRVKEAYPDKDIWLWSGYLMEDICNLEVAKYLDVVIDGKYVKECPTSKPWRGSDNQRMFRKVKGTSPVTEFTLLP